MSTPAEGQDIVPVVANSDLPDNAVLLDVRTGEEWSLGRAPDSLCIPHDQVAERLEEVPETDPVLVVCRDGRKSREVAAFLRGRGRNAVSVDGGMLQWAASNRPLSHDGPGAPEVH
ncbi:rhodanese-like domain-containing protein [Gephyromycinifex aptenodytis]|uniref:rhodanese-like domain-containing protein n=1 Tax=Gephyromycinifex aptenodytis TaxID=2716227 RepID=UPI001445A7D8|nr:rhodanese-like domain-containing protein [Gephyromycinifex aptenodytis]